MIFSISASSIWILSSSAPCLISSGASLAPNPEAQYWGQHKTSYLFSKKTSQSSSRSIQHRNQILHLSCKYKCLSKHPINPMKKCFLCRTAQVLCQYNMYIISFTLGVLETMTLNWIKCSQCGPQHVLWYAKWMTIQGNFWNEPAEVQIMRAERKLDAKLNPSWPCKPIKIAAVTILPTPKAALTCTYEVTALACYKGLTLSQ